MFRPKAVFGIEAHVLRQELLQEAVVAAANLEDQIRPRNGSIGERNDVYMRGRRGVVARRAGAGVEHAQREALHAVSVEVAAGEQVAGAEQMQVLIDLGDHVVAVVAEGRGEGLAAAAWRAGVPQGLLLSRLWITGLMVPPPFA